MATSEEIKIIVNAVTKSAERELKKLNKQFDKTGKQAKTNQDAFAKMGRGIKKIQANWLALTAAIGGAGMILRQTIKDASDLQETTQKFNVIFSDVSEEATSMADALAKGYLMSKEESMSLLASTGDLLTGFGMTGREALVLSTKVQTMAADLASFTNLQGGAARASEAITKAMIGEREMLKSLGKTVTEKMVQDRLALEGKKDLTGAALLQAKAEATLQLVIEQSGKAIGDVNRSQKSYANQSKLMNANLKNLSASIGNILLPAATKLVGVLASMAQATERLIGWFQENATAMRIAFAPLTALIEANKALFDIYGAIGEKLGLVAEQQVEANQLKLENELEHQATIVEAEATHKANLMAVEDEFEAAKTANLTKGEKKRLKILEKNRKKDSDGYLTWSKLMGKFDTEYYNLKAKNRGLDTQSYQNWSNFIMGSMDQTNKTQFKIYKAFAIQQALIATHTAAIQGYKAMVGIPVVGPELAVAAAAVAVAAGMMRVNAIRKMQMPQAAEGGLIPGSLGGTALIAGERNKAEAIIPLENEEAQEKLGGMGTTNININVETLVADEDVPRDLAEKIDAALYQLQQDRGSRL